MKRSGFSIIELLVVTTVMGILFGISVPNLFQARRTAASTAEMQYAVNVYKAANAYFSEDINATTLPTGADSCMGSYIIGSYGMASAPGSLTACSVAVVNGIATVTFAGVHSSATIQ